MVALVGRVRASAPRRKVGAVVLDPQLQIEVGRMRVRRDPPASPGWRAFDLDPARRVNGPVLDRSSMAIVARRLVLRCRQRTVFVIQAAGDDVVRVEAESR